MDSVLRTGVMEPVIAMISQLMQRKNDPDHRMLETPVWTLANLCDSGNALLDLKVVKPALSTLIPVISSPNDGVSRDVPLTLYCNAGKSWWFRDMVLKCVGICPLLEMIKERPSYFFLVSFAIWCNSPVVGNRKGLEPYRIGAGGE